MEGGVGLVNQWIFKSDAQHPILKKREVVFLVAEGGGRIAQILNCPIQGMVDLQDDKIAYYQHHHYGHYSSEHCLKNVTVLVSEGDWPMKLIIGLKSVHELGSVEV